MNGLVDTVHWIRTFLVDLGPIWHATGTSAQQTFSSKAVQSFNVSFRWTVCASTTTMSLDQNIDRGKGILGMRVRIHPEWAFGLVSKDRNRNSSTSNVVAPIIGA
jgi:hypothetical protein